MGRGTELAEGITIDEGLSAAGVRSLLHFQGDQVIHQRSQENMAEVLRHVQEMRERNERKGPHWGGGKEVGHVLEIHRHELTALRNDKVARERWLKAYFRKHPQLCAEPRYLR